MVPSVKETITYATAMQLLPAALAPLGPEYVKVLEHGLDPANGWIDVYPNKYKESGASSNSVYGVHPFVKMNYLDDLDSLSTLAHEYGHALHSHLSYEAQPISTGNYSMFLAEIASTFNEKLLNDHMLKNAKSIDERLFLLNKRVESIRSTIYRQTMFAEFELALHTAAEKGEPITAEFLNKTYAELVRAYYGPDFTIGPNDDIEWAYIPHFYYKYYVFVYATGLSSGLALAEKVGDPKTREAAREAYLGMLRSGCSKPPLEALKAAGVDLTRPDAIAGAARLLDETVTEMERLLAESKIRAKYPDPKIAEVMVAYYKEGRPKQQSSALKKERSRAARGEQAQYNEPISLLDVVDAKVAAAQKSLRSKKVRDAERILKDAFEADAELMPEGIESELIRSLKADLAKL